MTMKEIARALGVSQTTVSLTLSGKADRYGISANTQARVREYVRAVGYVPDADAAAMAAGNQRQVGIVIPTEAKFLTESQRSIFFNLLQLLHAENVVPLIQAIDAATCFQGLRFLAGKKVEDLVVIGFDAITLCEMCPDLLPIVRRRRLYLIDYLFVDTMPPEPVLPCTLRIGIDRFQSFASGLTLLRAQGHRVVAVPERVQYFLPHPPADMQLSLLELGERQDDYYQWGHSLTPEVLDLRRAGSTAVMLRNDMMALGLIAGLGDAGVRVPDDFSVLGFDNIPAAAYAAVPLSSIEVPSQTMLEILVARLLQSQEGDRDCLLPGRIISRASTGPVPVHA